VFPFIGNGTAFPDKAAHNIPDCPFCKRGGYILLILRRFSGMGRLTETGRVLPGIARKML
jgi:hypothetical protein